MASDRLTSADAAELLNVGVSTIKRWADEGIVPCIRTAGGHRRFERSALIEHAARALAATLSERDTRRWMDTVMSVGGAHEVVSALYGARHRLGAWWRVARELGLVLTELGRRWSEGELSILGEHSASERLTRGLNMAIESLPCYPEAPQVLLMTAEGDEHTLGLSLVELCAREAGWLGRWAGRATPINQLPALLGGGEISLVAVSASPYARDATDLALQCERLEEIAERAQIPLVLGGGGSWPVAPPYALRIRSFEALNRFFVSKAKL